MLCGSVQCQIVCQFDHTASHHSYPQIHHLNIEPTGFNSLHLVTSLVVPLLFILVFCFKSSACPALTQREGGHLFRLILSSCAVGRDRHFKQILLACVWVCAVTWTTLALSQAAQGSMYFHTKFRLQPCVCTSHICHTRPGQLHMGTDHMHR